MSTPSLKIEAHGTPSSLVPGSIYQNVRNNNLEIFTIVQTIPANPEGESAFDTPLSNTSEYLNDYEIIGSSADISAATTGEVSIGTDSPSFANLLAAKDYTQQTNNVPLLANLSSSVPGGEIFVRSAVGASAFTLTLRLILRKL